VAVFVALILTVSRSAWLGALFVTIIFLFAIFTQLRISPKSWQWRNTVRIKIPLIVSLLVSLALVFVLHLTNFQLFNRAQSTGTGLQKITVACMQNTVLPEKIGTVSELAQYGCRHIDLEDIQKEKAAGNFVTEIFRTDPNVNIRSVIYQKSWAEIKAHPVLGIGWGNSGSILGSDESGHALNSSNIFLETWLGAGILGTIALILILFYSLFRGIKFFVNGGSAAEKTLGIFLILGFFAFLVTNMFNAGIFLAIFWVFLATAGLKNTKIDV
jgi:O-antigen ligase